QDASAAGRYPDGLVVKWPVQHEFVAGLLQQIEGHFALSEIRTHPTLWLCAGKRCDFFSRFLDHATLFLLGKHVLTLAIGAAVTDDLIATRLDAFQDLRMLAQDAGVGVVRGWAPHLVQQIEAVP